MKILLPWKPLKKSSRSYVRYVLRWATIPNIKCEGQYEIDLLAIDPVALKRYHIESSISASKGFSRLNAKKFDAADLKVRVKIAAARRTLGYFRDRKFAADGVVSRLREFGFKNGNYKKIIVTWGWTEEAKREADAAAIELWDFRDLVNHIGKAIQEQTSYFADDTLRTIGLYVRATNELRRPVPQAEIGPVYAHRYRSAHAE